MERPRFTGAPGQKPCWKDGRFACAPPCQVADPAHREKCEERIFGELPPFADTHRMRVHDGDFLNAADDHEAKIARWIKHLQSAQARCCTHPDAR